MTRLQRVIELSVQDFLDQKMDQLLLAMRKEVSWATSLHSNATSTLRQTVQRLSCVRQIQVGMIQCQSALEWLALQSAIQPSEAGWRCH